MEKFYRFRRWSYAFFVLCAVCGVFITKSLSSKTHDAIEQRMTILPAPVYSNAPADTDAIVLTSVKNTVTAENTGKYTVYMIELDFGTGQPYIYTEKPLKKGEKAEITLKEDPEALNVISVGVDK